MGKISAEAKKRYFDKIKEYKSATDQILSREQTIAKSITGGTDHGAYKRLTLADERSNLRTILPMARSVGVPAARVLHPDPARDLAASAREFGRRIAVPAATGADFSLGILGIGTDGHTASLFSPELVPFPGSGEADGAGPAIAAKAGSGTPCYDSPEDLALPAGEQEGIERVSVSAAVLFAFRRLIFYAPGEAKQEIIALIEKNPEYYPAGRVLLQHPNAQVWTDHGDTTVRPV